MKNKGRGLTVLIALVLIALVAAVAVYAYKQHEYSVSTDYYDSLRGYLRWRCL